MPATSKSNPFRPELSHKLYLIQDAIYGRFPELNLYLDDFVLDVRAVTVQFKALLPIANLETHAS